MPALIRTATPADVPAVVELQHACYPLLATLVLWQAHHLEAQQRNFPEGQFVALREGHVVGHCATFRTTSERALRPHTFSDITARGTFDGHVPDGDVLYGAEIMVHPLHRRRGIARRFYHARFNLMRRLGIGSFVAGGRMPGYEKHADRMTAREYVDAVVAGRLTDRVLTPQLRSGLRVVDVLPDYMQDPRSRNYATLLLWQPDLRRARPR